MHPLVRDLYKRFMHVGKDYPLGLPIVREKVKAAFRANAGIQGQDALLRKVHEGRWWVGEMVGVIRLRKYRSLRQSYGVGSDLPFDAGKEALDISKDTKRAETAAAVGAAAAVAEAQAAAAAAAGAGATGSRSSSA